MEKLTNLIIKLVIRFWPILLIGFAFFSYYFIWEIPISKGKGFIDVENSIRNTHATIIGGIGAIVIIVVQIYRTNLLKKQVDQQQEQNNELNRASNRRITLDQYIKAVDQLKDKEIAVRLGGIYSLEQILNSDFEEDQKYHDMIIELFCAYVRNNRTFYDLQKGPPIGTDIQAILTSLSRRKNWQERKVRIDLRKIDINGFNLDGRETEIHFEDVFMIDSYIGNTFFRKAKFQGARFESSIFSNAFLVESDFTEANLKDTVFDQAKLFNVKLKNADLTEADFKGSIIFNKDKQNEVSKTDIINFIKELEKAKDIKDIKFDDIIMANIKKDYPELLERIENRKENRN